VTIKKIELSPDDMKRTFYRTVYRRWRTDNTKSLVNLLL